MIETGKRTTRALLVAGAVAAQLGAAEAAVIDGPDRRTIAEWATTYGFDLAAIEQRYGATGAVSCDWSDAVHGEHSTFSTGQVTVRRDLVTLSGHVFRDLDECYDKARPAGCRFTVTIGGSVQSASIEEVVAIGFDCDGTDYNDRLRNDWAVARLDRMLDVEPYAIPDLPGPDLRRTMAVMSVVHSQDYLTLGPEGEELHPKTVGRCHVRDLLTEDNETTTTFFTSDCDGAQRSSGGSVLNDQGETPVLIAIWVANSEGRPALDRAVARMIEAGGFDASLANSGNYSPVRWSSRHVPLSGEFLDTIRAEVGLDTP